MQIHESAYIDPSAKIGNGTFIWHFCHVMKNSVIGSNCVLGQNVMIAPEVIIGDKVRIQNNVSLYTGVLCEDEVFIGPSAVFTNVINPRSAVSRKHEYKKTIIRKGATVGANATVVCGVELGEYCFIGAGAVVTKAVKSYALVVGNPARQIGWMSQRGVRLNFNALGYALCSESGDEYQLKNGIVVKISQ